VTVNSEMEVTGMKGLKNYSIALILYWIWSWNDKITTSNI